MIRKALWTVAVFLAGYVTGVAFGDLPDDDFAGESSQEGGSRR